MSFKRARNEDQKRVRIQQILTSASQLLEEHPYKDISLEMIASKLNFSRANMSRYIASKEEIFLALFVDDIGLLCEEVLKQQKAEKASIPAFASLIANICAKHKNFLQIGAILNTIIEQNIDAESLAGYKKKIFEASEKLIYALQNNFSFLNAEDSMRLITILHHYIVGLYPATTLSDVQKEAIALSEAPYVQQDFTESLTEFIVLILTGYKLYNKTDKQRF